MTDCAIPPLKINRSSVPRCDARANNKDVYPLIKNKKKTKLQTNLILPETLQQNFKIVSRFSELPTRNFELKLGSIILPYCHNMVLFTFLARCHGLGTLVRSIRLELFGSLSEESSLHIGAKNSTRLATAYFQYAIRTLKLSLSKIHRANSSALK